MRKAQKNLYNFDNELRRTLPENQFLAIIRGSVFSGITKASLIDYKTKTVRFDNDLIKYMFERYKATCQLQQDEDKSAEFNYFMSLPNCDRAKHLLDGDPPMSMFGYSTIQVALAQAVTYCGTKPVLFPIPNERGGITADIYDCAAIRANSENAGTAMLLLQHLLGTDVQSSHGYMNIQSLPVRRDALSESLEWLRTGFGEAYGYGLESLTDKSIVDLQKILDRISSAHIQNRFNPVWGVESVDIQKELEEYINGQLTYDEMAKIALPKLIFYLNE
jgi:hypothetical protein